MFVSAHVWMLEANSARRIMESLLDTCKIVEPHTFSRATTRPGGHASLYNITKACGDGDAAQGLAENRVGGSYRPD